MMLFLCFVLYMLSNLGNILTHSTDNLAIRSMSPSCLAVKDSARPTEPSPQLYYTCSVTSCMLLVSF